MTDWLKKNLEILEARRPDLAAMAGEEPGPGFGLVMARDGGPCLVAWRNSREISLESRFEPDLEAVNWARKALSGRPGAAVVHGMALGRHVNELIKNSNDLPLALVEPEPDVFRLAVRTFDQETLLTAPNLTLIIGRPPSIAAESLMEFLEANRNLDPIVLEHAASTRINREYFAELAGHMTPDHEPGQAFIRPRFKTWPPRVLLLDSGYYLVREIRQGLKALECPVREIRIDAKGDGDQSMIRDLLRAAAEFEPDFLLTVNHLGFDAQGVLTELLEKIKLPFASWFVDSPSLILSPADGSVSELGSLFLWDSDYIGDMKDLGFSRVHYLPLAADVSLFRPPEGRPNPIPGPAPDAGFVGDSMDRPVKKLVKDLKLDQTAQDMVEEASREFIRVEDRFPLEVMDRAGLGPRWTSLDRAGRRDLEALVFWRSTQIYRLSVIRALGSIRTATAGDDGWKNLLPAERFRIMPELDYYRELVYFYHLCRVNLNATSLQMKSGLNQRVFDVPAAGAFLLTDYRRQLEDLFEPGREVIWYKSPEEALDLASFYSKNDPARRKIVEAGRARVLKDHTYAVRLEKLLKTMRKDHLV